MFFGQIYGTPHLEAINVVMEMAENNWTINYQLQPLPNGYLGEGKYAFTYKGSLLYNKNVNYYFFKVYLN